MLGAKAGVDPDKIVQVLSGGLAASRVLELKGPTMMAHQFEPGFRVDLHRKDLGIALSTAAENSAPMSRDRRRQPALRSAGGGRQGRSRPQRAGDGLRGACAASTIGDMGLRRGTAAIWRTRGRLSVSVARTTVMRPRDTMQISMTILGADIGCTAP